MYLSQSSFIVNERKMITLKSAPIQRFAGVRVAADTRQSSREHVGHSVDKSRPGGNIHGIRMWREAARLGASLKWRTISLPGADQHEKTVAGLTSRTREPRCAARTAFPCLGRKACRAPSEGLCPGRSTPPGRWR